MTGEGSRQAGSFRWDGVFWRKLAYQLSMRAPGWIKAALAPIIGAVLFACIGRNRRAVAANQRQILGTSRWWPGQKAAFYTFLEFARVFAETLEIEGRQSHTREVDRELEVDVQRPNGLEEELDEVLAGNRGLVVLTSHFGCWEMGARIMQRFERPVNLVMTTEANATVEQFSLETKKQHGLRVIHSNSSVFSSVGMIRALRRGEVVAMQLDRAAEGQVTESLNFFGRPAKFQIGPFMLARLARVPIWPVYVARTSRHSFRILAEPIRQIDRQANREEVVQVMQHVVSGFEQHVREYPHQWFQFHHVWEDAN